MNELVKAIKNLNLGGIELLALVTDTSYEVVFYANVNGKVYQSNQLVEEDLIDPLKLDAFYGVVARIVGSSRQFKNGMMNIVKVNAKFDVSVLYAEEVCHEYAIKTEWERSLRMDG